jgi:SAM-dependent methyltransferase
VKRSLEESYDDFPRIEEAFWLALDESLEPRGPDSLYDVVAGLALPPGTSVLDLGCGEGKQSMELAKRFGFSVTGVDPVRRNIELAEERRESAPELRELLRFHLGEAELIPIEDASVDLVWCREVFVLVADLDTAFAECRRVLRPGGRMLLYQMFATDRLEPREAERMFTALEIRSESWDPHHVEAAATGAGFAIEERVDFGSEWGEFAQEQRGDGGRRLLHTAHLLRDPERYIAQFGRQNYDIMLADCFWHVYRMIGKLSGRAYVLKAP